MLNNFLQNIVDTVLPPRLFRKELEIDYLKIHSLYLQDKLVSILEKECPGSLKVLYIEVGSYYENLLPLLEECSELTELVRVNKDLHDLEIKPKYHFYLGASK